MSVEVRIPTVFRRFTNQEAVAQLEPGTIADLVTQLDRRYPGIGSQLLAEDRQLHRFINIYLNDEDIRYLNKLETEASEGDTVSLLPSVAGG